MRFVSPATIRASRVVKEDVSLADTPYRMSRTKIKIVGALRLSEQEGFRYRKETGVTKITEKAILLIKHYVVRVNGWSSIT